MPPRRGKGRSMGRDDGGFSTRGERMGPGGFIQDTDQGGSQSKLPKTRAVVVLLAVSADNTFKKRDSVSRRKNKGGSSIARPSRRRGSCGGQRRSQPRRSWPHRGGREVEKKWSATGRQLRRASVLGPHLTKSVLPPCA